MLCAIKCTDFAPDRVATEARKSFKCGVDQTTFVSSTVKRKDATHYEVAGKLSIKGQTHDLAVPVQLTQAQGLSTVTGAFTLKRLDFKVGDGDWADPSVVANDVQVKFKLVLQGVPAL